MNVPFTKMHGAGNDFLVLDQRVARLSLPPRRIAALADRHRGIGWDQLIAIGAGPSLRFFNPDGGEAGACGNGTRCAADLLMRESGGKALELRTAAGLLRAERLEDGQVQVDMGAPALGWHDVPLAHEADTLHVPIEGDPAACSMGNPHVTFFATPLDQAGVVGPVVERDALFPDRVNAGFAAVLPDGSIRLRVWERGAGLTLACGSGACAAVVNAHRRGLTGRSVPVHVDGGALHITLREDGHVLMTGPVAYAFSGEFDPETYPA